MSSKRSAEAWCEVPVRFGMAVLATITITLLLWFIPPRAPQNGWWWDLLMGIGMLAAGLMLALPAIAPRVWVNYGGHPRGLQYLLYLHRDVTYLVLLLVFIHIVGLIVFDQTTIEYLKLSAPWSMLSATIAAVVLLVITISSLFRAELNVRYRAWRNWHIGMSIAAMALTTFHIVDAGFYLNSSIKKAVFVTLVAGPSLVSFGVSRWRGTSNLGAQQNQRQRVLRMPSARADSLRLITLLGILWFVWMVCFAIPEAGSRGDRQANQCAARGCD